MKKEPEQLSTTPTQIDALLASIMDRRPGLQSWWKKHQHMTLETYAHSLLDNDAQALQPREDVAAVIEEQAGILGSQRAHELGQQVLDTPVIITANHHGPDYIGLTRQGVGVLALALGSDKNVIVTACAGVPQNNLTYPRGIALARDLVKVVFDQNTQQPLTDGEGNVVTKTLPVRVNITPDSQRDTLVTASGPMTEEMIQGDGKKNRGALGQVQDMENAGTISTLEATALRTILTEDYLDPQVLAQPTLSDQITLLNDKLWRREFSAEIEDQVPGLAYLELEGVIGGLLERDLQNSNSLIYNILFDPSLRASILQNLDGVDACWSLDKLAKLSDTDHPLETQERIETMGGAGTMFFTGVDQKGRRVPLNLVGELMASDGRRTLQTYSIRELTPDMTLSLRGTDKSGNVISIPFTPDAIRAGLQNKTLIPSVFTDFAEILSRGLRAHGGFNQGNYFPRIKEGIVASLQQVRKDDWAKNIDTVPTDNLTAGLMFAVAKYGNQLKAAGGVDFVANPLTKADLNRMKNLTIREAFLFGAPEMYRVVCPADQRRPDLLAITQQDIYNYLGDHYVNRAY